MAININILKESIPPIAEGKVHIGAGVSFLVHYDVDEYQPMEKTRFLLNMGYLF